MTRRNSNHFNMIAALILALTLAVSGIAVSPAEAYAEDTAKPNIGEIWVVPEVIGGARIPADETMLAWVTFDYFYDGVELASDLDAADFTLQMKTQGSDWQDVEGNSIAVLGGNDYYIAYFEAIIAARVTANTDPFIKKWRVVYHPEGAEPVISEIVVQAAALEETDDVTAFNNEYCADFKVEQVPWSYEEYQKDHIPPVYIAYVYPNDDPYLSDTNLTTHFSDKGLTRAEGKEHKIVLPAVGFSWDYGEGQSFGLETFRDTAVELRLGDAEDDNSGIAGLVDYWTHYRDQYSESEDEEVPYYYFDEWPGSQEIPSAEDLYNKISSSACVTDENADEYLSYVIEGTNVFWISGASSAEAAANGVTDHILVVVRDYESYGTSKHDWSNAPEWTWKGSDETGYTAAYATFKCANHEGHKSKAAAVIRCKDNGEELTYTATAYFNGKTYRDVKTVAVAEEPEEPLPALTPAPASAPSEASVNSSTVNAAAVQQALQAAGPGADTLVLGSGVKKISKNALKGTSVKTLIVKTKKLKKKSVKGSLKGSSVKTVKVDVGSKKVNKKYVKKYKKFFTKKNAGKKVKVK